jgi:hypothetical protein
MRRRPSLLLKDTAERCKCLSIHCTECEHYDGRPLRGPYPFLRQALIRGCSSQE